MSEIASLLSRARALHHQKKHLAGKVDKDGTVISPPNYPAAESAIAEALALRQEAHRLDPDQSDPAWLEDYTLNHNIMSHDLMAWFRDYLTVDPIGPVAQAFKAQGTLPDIAETGQKMAPRHGADTTQA